MCSHPFARPQDFGSVCTVFPKFASSQIFLRCPAQLNCFSPMHRCTLGEKGDETEKQKFSADASVAKGEGAGEKVEIKHENRFRLAKDARTEGDGD